ncbi:MAG: nicotinate-nucleotide--dimethylbenzimidazole phosphoribosyltransferase [Firmicutes bacterium]|nr:nicotinate-nucleotide--dimethylbenzimidazole phosphoribosyltransferase [Bacillota bacterium]
MRFEESLGKIRETDKEAEEKAKKRWLGIAKPLYSLGLLEDMIIRISAIKRNAKFEIGKKALIIMCADNGITEEGITQTSSDMTAIVSENFTKGNASVCYMAKRAGVDIFPVDIGIKEDVKGLSDKRYKVGYGTDNMAKKAAMKREDTVKAIEVGINLVGELKEKGYGMIATGEMGIGNTATSCGVVSVLTGADVKEITGRGSGLDDEGLKRKIRAIEKAIEINRPRKDDIIDVLSKVGGYDICGLVGVFIGGGVYGIPIIIDGVISSAAALAAVRLCPILKDYMIASHVSKEPVSRLILEEIGLRAVIDADMCLGEGSGAVAVIPLIEMGYDVYMNMISFDDWGHEEDYRKK